MKAIYFKRSVLWIGALILSLTKFWVKNPKYSLIIFSFILEKTTVLPKFFSRNILIEKHQKLFEEILLKTINLYKKYGKRFNPNNPNSYKRLADILPEKMQILYFMVRKIKPKFVVETGVAAGKSTGYILQALKDNDFGNLYSIDLPFQWYTYGERKLHLDSLPPDKIPGFLVPEELKKKWKFILGNTGEKLPHLLKELDKIDIFFHDSEHIDKTMLFEYQTAWPYIKKGGYLLSDDINHTAAFNKFSKLKKMKSIIFKGIGVIKK